MKKPNIQSSKMLHEGFYNVRQDILSKEDGLTCSYTCIFTGVDAVAILAQDVDGKWIINREYRHPTGKYLLSCPGGRVEKEEDPRETARRELLEETGFFAEEILILGTSYPLPSICDQKMYFAFAKNVQKKKDPKREPFEYIETDSFTHDELLSEIQSGTETDGILCTALLLKQLYQLPND